MATSVQFKEQVCKQLQRYHPLRSKSMFGGVGIFSEESGNMFGLISKDDRLYLKVDDSNRPDFETVGANQFMRMPYFELPRSILDSDNPDLKDWVEKSADVAARAPAKKKKKKK